MQVNFTSIPQLDKEGKKTMAYHRHGHLYPRINNSGHVQLHTNIVNPMITQLLEQQSKDSEEKKKLFQEKKILIKENGEQTQELVKIRAELEAARKTIAEDTRQMSHIMKVKNTGGHEDANDPFSPTKLADKMRKVYEEQGLLLLEYFPDEVEGAKFLSRMMKICYDFCKKKAYSQLTQFCFLDDIEDPNIDEVDEGWIRGQMQKMMSEDDCDYMYYLQWKTATSKEAIHRIKKEALETICFRDENYSHLYADEVKTDAVKSFVQSCTEACWLIATCRPSLRLHFDVENMQYDSRIKKAFHVITTQEKVQLPNTRPGLIVAVLCPVLLTSADNSIILQGEVITTDFSGDKGNQECSSESGTEKMDED